MLKSKAIGILLAVLFLSNLQTCVQAHEPDTSPIYLAIKEPEFNVQIEEAEQKGLLKSTVKFYENTRQFQTGLSEKGYSIELGHTNDSMINFGGLLNSKSALKSMSVLDMSVEFDTQKMGLWNGGTAFVLGQTIYGKGLTDGRLGDLQTVSSIESSYRTQLSEFWYEQKLFDEQLRIAAGKHDANGEFGILEMAEGYLGSSFTLMPNIPMPSYPDQAIGTWGEISPTSLVSFKAGFYDGGSIGDDLGFRTAFNGRDGYITLLQGELKPKNGNYIFGYWTDSGNVETIGTDDTQFMSNNYGMYTAFQQKIFKDLSLMGQFSWTPSDRNEIARYYGAGVTYQGLLPKRNEDLLGVGMALADLSKRHKTSENLENETVLEFFYKLVLNDLITFQPDFQVVFHNGGEKKTAYALGLRTIISLAPRSPEEL